MKKREKWVEMVLLMPVSGTSSRTWGLVTDSSCYFRCCCYPVSLWITSIYNKYINCESSRWMNVVLWWTGIQIERLGSFQWHTLWGRMEVACRKAKLWILLQNRLVVVSTNTRAALFCCYYNDIFWIAGVQLLRRNSVLNSQDSVSVGYTLITGGSLQADSKSCVYLLHT